MNERTDEESYREDVIFTIYYYMQSQTKLHITLKSGTWLNGQAKKVDFENHKYVIITEDMFGEMRVLINDIKPGGIVPYKKEEKNGQK